MDGLKFGTSGLRGLVTELTDNVTKAYTTAFIGHLRATSGSPPDSLLVGRDLRASSPAIARSCMAAASEAGCSVFDCGAVPTPALALEAMRRAVPAIMVSGSHIPDDRNGLKFYRQDGEITKADETGIQHWLGRAEAGAKNVAGSITSTDEALEGYRRRYLGAAAFDLTGLRIGVYQHSSVARDLYVDVLRDLGAEVVSLGRSETFVPVDTEALRSDDIRLGREWAARERMDAIVSTDGDADRPLIADERGDYVRGDIVGLLTASMLGAEVVVTPVTSTSAIEQSGLFDAVIRTRVGSPYVIEAMAAHASAGQRVVGFEANGGVLLGTSIDGHDLTLSRLPTRDALLPILAVLSTVRRERVALSGLVSRLPQRFTASDRLQNVPGTVSARFLAMLSDPDALQSFTAAIANPDAIDTTDGTKMTFPSGSTLHFRASGNAPELRCYVEASSADEAARLLAWGLESARREMAGGVEQASPTSS